MTSRPLIFSNHYFPPELDIGFQEIKGFSSLNFPLKVETSFNLALHTLTFAFTVNKENSRSFSYRWIQKILSYLSLSLALCFLWWVFYGIMEQGGSGYIKRGFYTQRISFFFLFSSLRVCRFILDFNHRN